MKGNNNVKVLIVEIFDILFFNLGVCVIIDFM